MFVLAYRNRGGANRITADCHRRYFLQKAKIENYNIEIDGKISDRPRAGFEPAQNLSSGLVA